MRLNGVFRLILRLKNEGGCVAKNHGPPLLFSLYSNRIRYFLTKSCGNLKCLLESNEKEHGYD